MAKKRHDFNPGCLMFIIGVILTVVCFNLGLNVFRPPSFGPIHQIRQDIIEIDNQLFEVLARVDYKFSDEYRAIQKKCRDLDEKIKENKALYDSIPKGAVIGKRFGGSSNFIPVGDYKTYVNRKKRLDVASADLGEKKRSFAAERAPQVNNSEVQVLWEKRLPLMEQEEAYNQRKKEYGSTLKGGTVNFLHNFFIIVATISVITAMIGIFVAFE